MNFTFVSGDAARAAADLLVLPLFDSDLSGDGPAVLAALDAAGALDGALRAAATQEGFKGKAEQSAVLPTYGRAKAARVLLLGLGARARFTPEVLRLAAGRAAKTAVRLKAGSAVFVLPGNALPEAADGAGAEALVRAVVEGVALGAYKFDRYKTQGRDDAKAVKLERVALALPVGVEAGAGLKAAVDLGRRVAEAANWARDLVNEPPNVVDPDALADAARQAAREAGLKVEIRGRKDIAALKMGMFLGVAQGSAHEPRLIHLVYTPKDAQAARRAPLALVGKAITFDSGGLSLKPADSMVDMKTDMAGSAAVLAAMKVIGHLAPPFPVHAFIGACENMPSGTAYRPGDVLKSRLGKTVEITNTDAEGRLVLGDVLAWACEHEPEAVVDLATLTGACMVALGNYIVGAFGDDDAAVGAILDAGKRAGEELWRMPVSELQKDALRSEIADMKNSGERWGGAINAALFLKEFVGDTPWVHLDIAGPSQSPKERGYHSKGATGVGVRTLVEWVRARADRYAAEGGGAKAGAAAKKKAGAKKPRARA